MSTGHGVIPERWILSCVCCTSVKKEKEAPVAQPPSRESPKNWEVCLEKDEGETLDHGGGRETPGSRQGGPGIPGKGDGRQG